MAARTTQVVAEVLRSIQQASNAWFVGAATAVNLGYSASRSRWVYPSAATTVNFAYASLASRDVHVSSASGVDLAGAGFKVLWAAADAATTIALSPRSSSFAWHFGCAADGLNFVYTSTAPDDRHVLAFTGLVLVVNPLVSKVTSSDATSSIGLSHEGSGPRWVYPGAGTLLLLAYDASEARDCSGIASNSFVLFPAATQVRDVLPTASTALELPDGVGQVRETNAAGGTSIALDTPGSFVVDWPALATSTFAVATVPSTTADHIGDAATAIDFNDQGGESRDAVVAAQSTIGLVDQASSVRWVFPSASSDLAFALSCSTLRLVHTAAWTSLAIGGLTSECRAARVSVVTGMGLSSSQSGDGHPHGYYVEKLRVDDLASAVKATISTASTLVNFDQSSPGARAMPRGGVTSMALGGRAQAGRWVYPAAATAVSLAGLGIPRRAVRSSATTTVVVNGMLGSAVKDMHPEASTAFGLAGLGAGRRAANSAATSGLMLAVSMSDVRILYAEAETAIRFRGDAQPLFGPIGGNPMASQYVGYLGRYQQGQTVSLILRTVGYMGQLVTPDAPPVATIWADDGTSQSVSLPAIDLANRVFSVPVFLGLAFPLGRYRVAYRYSAGGDVKARVDYFEVIPGGDPGGAVISVFAYDRPEAGYVLAQLGGGKLVQGRNPRV